MLKATTCSVANCEKESGTRGWCPAHYQRWRTSGDVQAHIPLKTRRRTGSKPAICSVDGCVKTVASRGWCDSHYARWKSVGDVQADIPLRAWTPTFMHECCVTEGCDLPPRTRGLCSGHYERLLRDGDVRADVPLKVNGSQKNSTCSADGCRNQAFSRDWCRAHYQRWYVTGSVRSDTPINGHLHDCPEGHSWCPRCEKMMTLDKFHVSRDRARGVTGVCSACILANQKTKRPQIYAQQRRWRAANIDKARATERAWARRNPDKKRAVRRRLVAKYPERYRNMARAAEYRRRSREQNASGQSSAAQISARWAYYGGKCWMCGGPAEVMDHVKPLAKGGSNWPSNLRPACAAENRAKSDRWPFELSMIAYVHNR